MIRLLGPADAAAFVALRREALLAAPLAFLSSPGDDVAGDLAAAHSQLGRAPDSVIFGAFDAELVGSVGLYRDSHAKAAHKAHLWGMYVRASHRRRGLARALLDVVLEHAEALPGIAWVQLGVSAAAPEAERLYTAAGFRPWGSEPDAMRHEGRVVAEQHMALELASRAPA